MTQLKTQTEYLKFALKNGQLVSIDEVPNGNDCGCQCPACGKDLCARNNGTKRIHHFAHQSGADCPGAVESSIHLLAKKVIKERFYDAGKSFLIQFVRECKCCNYETCQFADEYGCKKTMPIGPFDLKEHYDTCEEEVPEGDFRPDLLLKSSKHQDQPIYIEVFYKHKCEENKLFSGKKIIEIKVENEEDVLALGTIDVFKECNDDCFDDFEPSRILSNVTFYNFSPKIETEKPLSRELRFSRFFFYNNGSAYCQNDSVRCDKLNERSSRNVRVELLIEDYWEGYLTPYHYGLVYLMEKDYDVKHCFMCKYYKYEFDIGKGICALYKKYGTTKNPTGKEAKECSYYRLDTDLIKTIHDKINNGLIIIELQ